MTPARERTDTATPPATPVHLRAAARPSLAALVLLALMPSAATACGPASPAGPAAPSTSINDYRHAMAAGSYHAARALLARRPESEPFVVVDLDLVMTWHQTTFKPRCAASPYLAGPDFVLCRALSERAMGITRADWHTQLLEAGVASGFLDYRRPLLDALFYVRPRQPVEPKQDVPPKEAAEPTPADGNK